MEKWTLRKNVLFMCRLLAEHFLSSLLKCNISFRINVFNFFCFYSFNKSILISPLLSIAILLFFVELIVKITQVICMTAIVFISYRKSLSSNHLKNVFTWNHTWKVRWWFYLYSTKNYPHLKIVLCLPFLSECVYCRHETQIHRCRYKY